MDALGSAVRLAACVRQTVVSGRVAFGHACLLSHQTERKSIGDAAARQVTELKPAAFGPSTGQIDPNWSDRWSRFSSPVELGEDRYGHLKISKRYQSGIEAVSKLSLA